MDDLVNYEIAKSIASAILEGIVEGWVPGELYEFMTEDNLDRMCMVEQMIAEAEGFVGNGDV